MGGTHIVISGIDGSGKTTQARLLQKSLISMGHKTAVINLLSKTEKEILNKLLERFDDFAITLLYEALHRQKFIETQNALRNHSVVVSDRWSEVFDVHHSLYGALKDNVLLRIILKEVSFENLIPNFGILIDINPRIAMARTKARGMDHFDRQCFRYFSSIREGLLDYAQTHKWVIINGDDDRQIIQEAIVAHILPFLKNPNCY